MRRSETTLCSGQLLVVDAVNDGEVGAVAGAETITALGAAVRCAEALSRAVKMPVHSSAMSTFKSLVKGGGILDRGNLDLRRRGDGVAIDG